MVIYDQSIALSGLTINYSTVLSLDDFYWMFFYGTFSSGDSTPSKYDLQSFFELVNNANVGFHLDFTCNLTSFY